MNWKYRNVTNMKVVLAPDSFKECLSATAVAAALGRGVLDACEEAEIDLCPMSDGGEGTVEALVAGTGGKFVSVDVFDPLGSPIRARFGLLGMSRGEALPGELGLTGTMVRTDSEEGSWDGRTAVVEMAAASGLSLVPLERRDPRLTTTFGTGGLIMGALDAGARDIIVGVGGSATVDAGTGCAQALGVVFVDSDGRPCVCGLGGGGLTSIAGIDMSDRDPRISEARIRVACDVTNPLTGPDGAGRVYAPQKGATPEMVDQLEEGLQYFASVVRRDLGIDVEHLEGAGAAGGLAAGLVAFTDATLESGVEIIAEAVGLERRLRRADLCITGEGRFDGQSGSGKTTVGVARIAKRLDVPVVCIPGQSTIDAPRESFDDVRPLVAGDVTVRRAMIQTKEILRLRAAEAMRSFPG